MNLGILADITCLSGLGKRPAVRKPTKLRKPLRQRVASRGDTELPPDSPEWMKKLAAADPEKWKRIIGGAMGDMYKLTVMAGLADAANLKDVGITEAHIFGGGKGRTGADGVPLTPEQEAEFRRAMKFADSIYSVGMKIKDVKGMDKVALASALSEFLPQQKVDEIINQMNQASGGIKELAIKTFLGAGDEGPMRRYFRARELAAEFQRQRDNASGQLSKGVSLLTTSGLENLKNSLTIDPKLLLSEVVAAPMAIANGVMDALPSIPSLPEPSFTQVSKGKIWITGQDNGPISAIEPASVGDLAYDVFYTILKSEPPPLNANINSEKDLVEYGGTLLANSVAPMLASRFVKKKALQAISNLGKSSPVSINKEEKKMAKLLFNTARKIAISVKNPNSMASASKAANSLNESLSKLALDSYNKKVKLLLQQMKGARTIQELEDYSTDMLATVHQIRQNGGDVPINLQPQIADLVQRKQAELNNKPKDPLSPGPTDDIATAQRKRELSSLLVGINMNLISLESRVQTYKSFGGAAPDFSQINAQIQQANRIASDLGRNLDGQTKSELSSYRNKISNLTNTVSTYTPIGGGSGPGVSAGGNNQPQNPYNYYPSSGGEMGPFPQTQPPVQPNYTIAGLGDFTSGVPTWLKVAAAIVGSWMIYKALSKR